MKKISLAILFIAVTVFSFVLSSCGKSEKILESSGDEKTVIGQVGSFDIPMEIYRYVALNYRTQFENGDPDVWTKDGSDALLDRLNSAVDETVAGMYTTLSVCEDYGISPDDAYISDAVDAKMKEIYLTHGNDYKAYTKAISEYNMNDAVYRFLIRDEILSEELLAKMIEKGDIPALDDSFRKIAEGDEFVRVKQILITSINGKTEEDCLEEAETILAKLKKGEDFDDLIGEYGEDVYMFNNSDGYYISRGSYYSEFEDAAFSLGIGEYSDIIKTNAGISIIRRYEKDASYIESHLDDMYVTYRDGIYNLMLEEKKSALSVEWNDKAEKYSIFNLKKTK